MHANQNVHDINSTTRHFYFSCCSGMHSLFFKFLSHVVMVSCFLLVIIILFCVDQVIVEKAERSDIPNIDKKK